MMSTSSSNDWSGQVFDYVIIGGGTAGLTLGAKLAENPDITVAILEAGSKYQDDALITTTGLSGHMLGNPIYDWAFHTVPQPFSDGRNIFWPRGKMLGGTSALNLAVWSLPPKIDVDNWGKLGNPGWDWTRLREYIKKIEGLTLPSDNLIQEYKISADLSEYGHDGPLKLMFAELVSEVDLTVMNAMHKLGLPWAKSPHNGEPLGICRPMHTWDYETHTRSYATTAFYLPNEKKANFNVICDAHVTRVVTNKEEGELVASGVEFLHNDQLHTVHAKKEVILSAGTVQTPQILELSGIGDPTILTPLGIETKLELPGVGTNLQDRVAAILTFELSSDRVWESFDKLFDPESLALHKKLHGERKGLLTMGLGPMALVTLEALVASESRAKDMLAQQRKYVENNAASYLPGLKEQHETLLAALESGETAAIEILGWPGHFPVPGEKGKSYMTVMAIVMHPFQRGTIHATSMDPKAPPGIDSHFCEEEFDLDVLMEALKYIRRLFDSETVKPSVAKETIPGPLCETDDALKDYIRKFAMTTWHPVGTASMLPREKNGVVDPTLKVYGSKNIRVVDCSVIPLQVASHIQALAYGVAAQAADMIAA